MSDIESWLEQQGLGKFVETFIDNEIQVADLVRLTD
jgi:hypothetical protein